MNEFTSYSDDQLVRLLRQDSDSSFTAIYDRYWKPLFLSARNVLQQKEPAEDAVQEVFVSLWRRRREVEIGSLKAYLYQATRFQVLKAIREDRVSEDFFSKLIPITRQLESEEPLLFKELTRIVQHTYASLNTEDQEIFRLHRDEGLTYKEIAAIKGISVKTVEKKMSRALKQFRAGLDKVMLLYLISHLFK